MLESAVHSLMRWINFPMRARRSTFASCFCTRQPRRTSEVPSRKFFTTSRTGVSMLPCTNCTVESRRRTKTRRRYLRTRSGEIFSKQDLRNLAWFESIPIQFSLGAEFVLSRTFDFLVDSSGDVMKEIGVPVISYEGEIPVATAVAVKVGIRLMMKAPYEFAMVSMRSGLEFRFKTNFDMRIDIATGEIMSTFDTSKDGVTGVRMLGNKLAGHAYAGFQVELGVDVGVCIATFCFDISLNYTQDVLGMGFDFIMDPGKTETFEDSSSVRRFLLQESPDAATNGMDITGLLEKVPEGSELAKTIKAMDKSGDGYLSVDEFETGMKDVIVQTTTSAAGETTATTAAAAIRLR